MREGEIQVWGPCQKWWYTIPSLALQPTPHATLVTRLLKSGVRTLWCECASPVCLLGVDLAGKWVGAAAAVLQGPLKNCGGGDSSAFGCTG